VNTGEVTIHEGTIESAPVSPAVIGKSLPGIEGYHVFNSLMKEMQHVLFHAEGILSEYYLEKQVLTPSNTQFLESLRINLRQIEDLIAQILDFPKCECPVIAKEAGLTKRKFKKHGTFKGLIGNSPPMQGVYDMIEKIADTDTTILISGESGTGKELVAKIIHMNSRRSQEAFVPLNCAAIPKDLLESELFGHEKGAFTGALNTRIGRFELAHGGTLFLDEIGELEPSLQVKLLRVLQEREFERVGGIKTIKIDVRILAATNKDLEQAMRENRFREDLYYRLNVIPLSIPPLRDRSEDIPLLVDHFNRKYSARRGREPLTFSPDVMRCLTRFHWPGNVRELENLVERLVILTSDSCVRISDMPDKFSQHMDSQNQCSAAPSELHDVSIPEMGIDMNAMLGGMERTLILRALEKAGGVKNRAAKLLGLNRTTLIEKMKKMGIEPQKTCAHTPNS